MMAEKEGSDPKAAPAARPTIALPPRSTYESLFFGRPEASSGPLTLVSNFFSEDPESDCRSFSQLLAGAMASPVGVLAGRVTARSSSVVEGRRKVSVSLTASVASSTATPVEGAEKETRAGGGERPHRPLGVMVAPSPFFTVSMELSPTSLLESPTFSPAVSTVTSLESFHLIHLQLGA